MWCRLASSSRRRYFYVPPRPYRFACRPFCLSKMERCVWGVAFSFLHRGACSCPPMFKRAETRVSQGGIPIAHWMIRAKFGVSPPVSVCMATVAPQNRRGEDRSVPQSPAARFAHDSGTLILHFFPDIGLKEHGFIHSSSHRLAYYIYNQSTVVKIASSSRSSERTRREAWAIREVEEGSNVEPGGRLSRW